MPFIDSTNTKSDMTSQPIENKQLFAQHQKKLLGFIRSKVGHAEDAEDILSQVFIKLLQQQQAPNKPVAWLNTVTKNAIIDYYRIHRNHTALPEAECSDDCLEEASQSDQYEQISACLRPMVEALKPRYRDVLFLADIEGQKQAAVAKQLGISLPATKSRILRGRKELHLLLQRCCPPERDGKGRITDFKVDAGSCNNC